jgi:hypothetical protein
VNEDKLERALDIVWDVANVVLAAGLLAFVAYVWTGYSGRAAGMVFTMFAAAYFVGRWHCSKDWERSNANLKEALDGLLAEMKRIEDEKKP